jgi:hypothetical protein
MKKIVLTFGLIAGAIMSAMMALTTPFMDKIGFDNGLILGYTAMVAAFLLIYVGVRSYRDNVAGGTVSFGRALKVGALIALVASSCYVATWQVLERTVTKDFMEKYAAHTIEKARVNGESEEKLAQRRADMEKFSRWYRNPVFNVAMTFLEPLPVALVMTLVTAGVVSRRRGATSPEVARRSRVIVGS